MREEVVVRMGHNINKKNCFSGLYACCLIWLNSIRNNA